jgi:cell wall-active antibiotic response 4TMS protein YvqF
MTRARRSEIVRGRRRSDIAVGVLLVALGLIFLGYRLEIVPELDAQRLWPIVLLAIGIGRFAVPRPDGRRGLWLIFLGGIFLLHNYRLFMLRDSWPLFIVMGGLSLVLGHRASKDDEDADTQTDSKEGGSQS